MTLKRDDEFVYYMAVADELDGGLTMDDLDVKYVQQSHNAAIKYDLPWPPELSYAEEFLLDAGGWEPRSDQS